MSHQYDVIIVGAGISGLCAAKWLFDSGVHNLVVLEARDRVGGRTFTKRAPECNWVDLGGAYVGPTQDHLIRVVSELGIDTSFVNEREDLVLYKNGKRYKFPRTDVPKVGVHEEEEIKKLYQILDDLGADIPVREPWAAPRAKELDALTFADFLRNEFSTNFMQDFGKLVHNVFLASAAHECSLLFFLWYVKQAFGAKRIFSTTHGAQERKFVGGSGQISEKLARWIGDDKVLLNKPVRTVLQTWGKRNTVKVVTLDGTEYVAGHVIMALSPTLVGKVHFEPALHPMKAQLYQRMPMGSVIKTMVYYERAWWRANGMCGTIIIDSDEDPVEWTFDDTKPDGTKPAIVGFILAARARNLMSLTKEERLVRICKSYARGFGCDEALKPIHYEENDWSAEEYSGGCYTGICPPGVLTAYGPYIRAAHGMVFFAGTETATVWSGYMSGAVEAGERAAREVLAARGSIPAHQIWRDEPESKDIPHCAFDW